MKQNKEFSYAKAVEEIEGILGRFENQQYDVDTLSAEVKRAAELLKLCREKLRKAESEITEVLKDQKQ